jgi:hypothetical protein
VTAQTLAPVTTGALAEPIPSGPTLFCEASQSFGEPGRPTFLATCCDLPETVVGNPECGRPAGG